MVRFDAMINVPSSVALPDPWTCSPGELIPVSHVISRNVDGAPASLVGDFIWDWTAYDPRGRTRNFYFYYWTGNYKRVVRAQISSDRVARMHEMQQLMALLVFRKEGEPLGAASIKPWLIGISEMALFAESVSCSVKEVLGTRDLLDALITSVTDFSTKRILAWLKFLWKLERTEQFLFPAVVPRRLRELQGRAQSVSESDKQHVPLPTRIYASVINSLIFEMRDIEEHAERLIAALRAAIGNKDHVKKGNTFGRNLISHYGLEEYFDRRGIELSLLGLSSAIADIYRVCKMQIHVFSGMRDAEAEHLPFYCTLSERRVGGGLHAIIVGVTSKLNGGHPLRGRWVTTEQDGFRAIRIAQRFSSVIYGCLGVHPRDDEKGRDHFPLFLSTTYLPWWSRKPRAAPKRFSALHSDLGDNASTLRVRLAPTIESHDLLELEEIDPHRDWSGEPDYAVGARWPLKPHQLRRSLALYANASGLVRASSLRRQLHHITREMSLYYARGSAFAINFLSDDPTGFNHHIIREWQAGVEESQYLAFVRDVLESDESLYGPAGKFYEMQKARGEVISPDHLKKQIKMGRLAYQPTPLGGCTNPAPCHRPKGLRLVNVACITESCKHLIGKHSEVIRVIKMQRTLLSRMDPRSITFQLETEDLDDLLAAEAKWRPARIGPVERKGSEGG